jgi:hypothetical protein
MAPGATEFSNGRNIGQAAGIIKRGQEQQEGSHDTVMKESQLKHDGC